MACKHGSMVFIGSDLSARPVTRIMSDSQSYQKLAAATDMVIECQCSTAERTHRTTINYSNNSRPALLTTTDEAASSEHEL